MKKKIANPERLYPDWEEFSQGRKERCLNHWKQEIQTMAAQKADAEGELKRRGES